jgi:RNA polymerase sigma-70 factor (ECF subfamily)
MESRAGDASVRRSDPAVTQDLALRAAVADVVGGQQERFDDIVAVIGDQIHAVAWRLTQNPDDALDVSQEALLRIYKALPAWKGRCKFTTWAHRVVLNTAVDYLRRQSKHYRGRVETPSPKDQDEPFEPQEWAGVTEYTAADALERTEVRRRILQALELLSARQRKCFMLRHFQELTVREVAEVLGTTEGTVKRHLFRACRRLRELLSAD